MTGSSRDTQFELDIAALLFRAKINALRFDARHDLVCSLLHNPLIIECKRPRKNKTLRDLYASGAHQIESSPLIKENPDTKGIVALDLTQVISPSLKGSRYNSINEMQNAFTQAFVKKWGRLQITISDYSDRVSALHLFCGGPSYLENRRFLRSFSDSAEPHRYQHKRLKKKPQNRIHISRFFNARQQHILDDLKKRRVKFRSLRKQSTLKGPQFSPAEPLRNVLAGVDSTPAWWRPRIRGNGGRSCRRMSAAAATRPVPRRPPRLQLFRI